jgi:hypothetical protein
MSDWTRAQSYLVTGARLQRTCLYRCLPWLCLLETREQTDHVVCRGQGDQGGFAAFLSHARALSLTVQGLEHRGDQERYQLLVGDPGSGWPGPAQKVAS